MEQTHLSPHEEASHAWALANRVIREGFTPDLVLSLYRGGGLVAPTVVEALREIMGWEFDDFPLKARRYNNDNVGGENVILWGVDALPRPPRGRRILLLDDIYDKGDTMRATVRALRRHYSPLEMEIRIGASVLKEGNDTTGAEPDFYGVRVPGKNWLVQTYEKEGGFAERLRDSLRADGYPIIELKD